MTSLFTLLFILSCFSSGNCISVALATGNTSAKVSWGEMLAGYKENKGWRLGEGLEYLTVMAKFTALDFPLLLLHRMFCAATVKGWNSCFAQKQTHGQVCLDEKAMERKSSLKECLKEWLLNLVWNHFTGEIDGKQKSREKTSTYCSEKEGLTTKSEEEKWRFQPLLLSFLY